MPTLIINPAAGSANQAGELREALDPMGDVTILETQEEGDGQRLARQAAADGATLIIAAGGDGTINEVINGLATLEAPPTLGVLPLGTGNDLARTLAIPADPIAAFDTLLHGTTQMLDLVKITGADVSRYALNVAAGGFSGQVNEILSGDLKAAWGPLAYLRGALAVLPDLTNYRIEIAYDDEEPHQVDALNVIVANCRTAAGGILVAPTANPQDGLLDVVIVHDASIRQLLGTAATLLLDGNYLNSDYVTHRRAKRIHIHSTPGMWFNADGELLTNEALTFELQPSALPVIVGPDYQANVDAKEESRDESA